MVQVHTASSLRNRFRLGNAQSLLPVLGGDFELNPGPREDEMHDKSGMCISTVLSITEQNILTELKGLEAEQARQRNVKDWPCCQHVNKSIWMLKQWKSMM